MRVQIMAMFLKPIRRFITAVLPQTIGISKCGDFGIQVAVKQALTNLQIEPHNVAFVSDIGCSGKIVRHCCVPPIQM